MVFVGILAKAICSKQQLTYCLYGASQLELPWMLDSTSNIHEVRESGTYGINHNLVSIAKLECSHLELVYRMYAVLASAFPLQPYILLVGIARKSSGIGEKVLYALRALHFVYHWPLDTSLHIHKAFVRANHNDILVLQTHITAYIAIDDVVVHVYGGNQATRTINLDGTKGSYLTDATCHVQRIECAGQTAEGIGSRGHHLAHYLHLYAPHVAQREVEPTVGIVASKHVLQQSLCL